MHLNDGGEYAAALAPAMILVDQAPQYVEAHHQLAICWQGLENHYQAESAYRACLWQCRYHYPAWQGLARCWLMLDESERAEAALQRCLDICPDVESARMQIASDSSSSSTNRCLNRLPPSKTPASTPSQQAPTPAANAVLKEANG